jgi:hypothetical protein
VGDEDHGVELRSQGIQVLEDGTAIKMTNLILD